MGTISFVNNKGNVFGADLGFVTGLHIRGIGGVSTKQFGFFENDWESYLRSAGKAVDDRNKYEQFVFLGRKT